MNDRSKIDDRYGILANKRRRDTIRYLKEQEEAASTLSELAEYLAAKENGIDEKEVDSKQRKRVYIAMYQCHLPKMDDYGTVQYDKNRGTIQLRDTEELDPYLALTEENQAGEAMKKKLAIAMIVGIAIGIGMAAIGILIVESVI